MSSGRPLLDSQQPRSDNMPRRSKMLAGHEIKFQGNKIYIDAAVPDDVEAALDFLLSHSGVTKEADGYAEAKEQLRQTVDIAVTWPNAGGKKESGAEEQAKEVKEADP